MPHHPATKSKPTPLAASAPLTASTAQLPTMGTTRTARASLSATLDEAKYPTTTKSAAAADPTATIATERPTASTSPYTTVTARIPTTAASADAARLRLLQHVSLPKRRHL